MEKVIKDGNVAVLVSYGYGAGWYSWHGKEELLFHPKIVELVEQKRHIEITEDLCKELLGTDEYICTIGSQDLEIRWIPQGTAFYIDEYDGAESLNLANESLIVA